MVTSDEILNDSTNIMNSYTIPAIGFVGRMLGCITDSNLLDILQIDLQRKTSKISLNNLYLNYQNNYLLNEIVALQATANSQLYEINNQLHKLVDLIETEYEQIAIENEAKDLIYNIKKYNDQLTKTSDKVYVSYKANLLLAAIDANGITSRSFSQINDKEYFDNLVSSLKDKVEALSEDDDIDLKCFVLLYQYTCELINDYTNFTFIELKDTSTKIEVAEKPEYPKLLNIQRDIENEIESESPVFAFGSGVYEYINDYKELNKLFDEYFEQKKNYLISEIKYKRYTQILDLYSTEKKSKEILSKLGVCKDSINKYLELHPLLKEYFNEIDFDFKPEEKDVETCIAERDQELTKLNAELNQYYKTEIEILSKKESKIIIYNSKKMKKQLGKILKIILPIVAVIVIVLIILIRTKII